MSELSIDIRLAKWLAAKKKLTDLKSKHKWVQEDEHFKDLFVKISQIGDELNDQTKISEYEKLE